MRFLQICADPGIAPGSTKGAAQHLRGIAAGLGQLGHHVVTATARRAEGPFPAPLIDLGSVSPAMIAETGIEVIYERYSLGHTGGLDLARATGRPFVLEVNAPLVAEATAHRPDTVSPGAAGIEVDLLAGADLVITVSTDLARWAAGHRPAGAPTMVLPNGFEPAWFTCPAQPELDGPLVFLGHPKPWHGADRLPHLVAGLVTAGLDPELLIIGGGGGVEPILARAAALGVADRIEVTGALPPERATSLLSGASIGLAPYRRQDPFYFCPLKVIDYLAAGLPVVASDQGDIAALVGSAGLLVDPDDDRALVAATADLLADPDRRRLLGRSGRARAGAERSWIEVARSTVSAIEPIIGSAIHQARRPFRAADGGHPVGGPGLPLTTGERA